MRSRRFFLAVAASVLPVGCTCVARAVLEPEAPFDPRTAPEAPDYSRASSWAALPNRRDLADVVARGETDRQAEALVDVFFVHYQLFYLNIRRNAEARAAAFLADPGGDPRTPSRPAR